MPHDPPPLRTIARAFATGLGVAVVVILLASPASGSTPLRVLELVVIFAAGLLVLVSVLGHVIARLAGWTQSESEFELTVRRSERLAREGLAPDPDELELLELDPMDDADFEELVRDALDDMPDLLLNALEHVAVVISSGGRRARAYGLYEGSGRDGGPGRIVVFRDTLRRDFGRDPQALRRQVTRTVRHELAHHVGFDELGVGELGL
ncbi:MAG TPA: metallopeptidase family protein [Solirubrobacteraceae bacterium]|nr:metallopeptidase family protein [Solirubrobacteraceae bacterium]